MNILDDDKMSGDSTIRCVEERTVFEQEYSRPKRSMRWCTDKQSRTLLLCLAVGWTSAEAVCGQGRHVRHCLPLVRTGSAPESNDLGAP